MKLVVDRVHILTLHVPILSAIGFTVYMLVFLFFSASHSPESPATSSSRFTIAYVQLLSPLKLPFTWLFHLNSIVFLSLCKTLIHAHSHWTQNGKLHVCSYRRACVWAIMRGVSIFRETKASKNISITESELPKEFSWSNWIKHSILYSIFYMLL